MTGAPAVLESAERKKPLPPLSALPICTRILEGTTLCISGTTGEKKVSRIWISQFELQLIIKSLIFVNIETSTNAY